ncbi:MAG: hypothetical protein ABR927_04470 [Bacteroidales bacterium]|jgi:hypothetical protein
MKRKIIYFVTLLTILGLVTIQSCKKAAPVGFGIHHVFTAPVAVAPANDSTITISGTTVDLTWASTNPDGDPVFANVYFGTSSTPPLYKSGATALTLTVSVELGQTYYWHVTMIDANNQMTAGPTWNFTVFEPIAIFVGDFTADEPAEAYTYPISFAKSSPTTLLTDNYWNSGWAATFTLDFTAKTYSMPLTTWAGGYSAIESGTIDPKTGTMTGNYTIYHPAGVAIETGVHTYTKNSKK